MFTNYDGVLKVDGEVGNKKAYDPRAYLKLAEVGMAARVVAGVRGPAVGGPGTPAARRLGGHDSASATCSQPPDPTAGRPRRRDGARRRRRARAHVAAASPGLVGGLGRARRGGPGRAAATPSRRTPTRGPATTAASTRCAGPAGRARDRCRGSTRRTRASCAHCTRSAEAAAAIGEQDEAARCFPSCCADSDPSRSGGRSGAPSAGAGRTAPAIRLLVPDRMR